MSAIKFIYDPAKAQEEEDKRSKHPPPSLEEIAAARASLQRGWSDAEYDTRAGRRTRKAGSVPVAKLHCKLIPE